MRIALAQINYHIGNFSTNVQKMKDAVQRAADASAELIIFAELAISGYPPRDFLEFSDFIAKCSSAIKDIAKECTGIAAIIGGPTINPVIEGKYLHNSAFFLSEGKIKEIRHKTLLPNYDIFDEYRYFEPNKEFNIIEFKGHRIALTICEDLWDIEEDLMYTVCPMDELMKQQPDIMINIAASPFHYHQANTRIEVLRQNVEKYSLPLFYVNHVGAQTELIFDGGSVIFSPDGSVFESLNYFEEDLRIVDLEEVMKGKEGQEEKGKESVPGKMALIHDALVMGIRNYFVKLGFTKAILGLSGGIDSALTLVLATEALGSKNVLSVLLPSPFSSDHSVNDSLALVKNLNSPHEIISINEMYSASNETLKIQFEGLPFNVTEENIQARLRALVLMALSNKFGYILLNTSNKSEAAVGYGTLYGDMCGGLSVIGDLYKTEVYELAEYINRNKEIIPGNIITKPPSAELRPNQKDSDSLPDYDILDEVLFQYIEERKGPREIVNMGFDEALVSRVLKLVNTNEYKRYQTPPILRVSQKAFGMGRRLPIVGKYLS